MEQPVFPFRPNWHRPLVERLEWLTDVEESKNGTEVRDALRQYPRRSIEFDILLQKHALARLDALLWYAQAKQFVVPIWMDAQALAAPVAQGAEMVAAATVGMDFEVGGLAVLWLNDGEYEALQVESVSESALSFAVPTSRAWPAGTMCYPARLGRLPENFGVSRASAAVGAAAVRFEFDSVANAAQPGAIMYRGAEVHLRRPNWIQNMGTGYSRKLQKLDYQTGPVFVDDLSGMPTTMRTHQYLLRDRAEIASFRGWLYARRGRWSGFWQPQWLADLAQTGPISAAAVTLRVKRLDIATRYGANDGRRDIAIRRRSTGQWVFRRVDSVTIDGADELLTLNASLGFAAATGDLFITWMAMSRLDADAVEIAWHSAGVAVTAFDMRSVRP